MTQTHRLLRTHILCITNPRVWNDKLVSHMLLIVRLYGMQRSLLALAKKLVMTHLPGQIEDSMKPNTTNFHLFMEYSQTEKTSNFQQ